MYIYKFEDNELSKVDTLNPYWIKDKDNITDMKRCSTVRFPLVC